MDYYIARDAAMAHKMLGDIYPPHPVYGPAPTGVAMFKLAIEAMDDRYQRLIHTPCVLFEVLNR